MKKILCWLFGHKYEEWQKGPKSGRWYSFCERCGKSEII